jgi:hypothetical protein
MGDMYNEIVEDINKRISAQPNSMCATGDEVRICWLVAEVEKLRSIIVHNEETKYEEWLNKHEEELQIECAESGGDREMCFDFERFCEERFYKTEVEKRD